jgi:predicted TIM-barrel fold metal-dependent hydrolase
MRLRDGESVEELIMRHIREGRIFIGCEGEELTLPYAVKIAGYAPFMYSSDFPHEVNLESCRRDIVELTESAELSADAKQAIMHGNAERFYGLT